MYMTRIFWKEIGPSLLFPAAVRPQTFWYTPGKGHHRLLNWQVLITTVSWVGRSTTITHPIRVSSPSPRCWSWQRCPLQRGWSLWSEDYRDIFTNSQEMLFLQQLVATQSCWGWIKNLAQLETIPTSRLIALTTLLFRTWFALHWLCTQWWSWDVGSKGPKIWPGPSSLPFAAVIQTKSISVREVEFDVMPLFHLNGLGRYKISRVYLWPVGKGHNNTGCQALGNLKLRPFQTPARVLYTDSFKFSIVIKYPPSVLPLWVELDKHYIRSAHNLNARFT